MKAVHGNIDGPLALDEDIALYGRISGARQFAAASDSSCMARSPAICGWRKMPARSCAEPSPGTSITTADGWNCLAWPMPSRAAHDGVTIIDPAAHVLGGGTSFGRPSAIGNEALAAIMAALLRQVSD
ncbi:hypothetical protein ACFSHP_26690 [Novosphingobium panipatense]